MALADRLRRRTPKGGAGPAPVPAPVMQQYYPQAQPQQPYQGQPQPQPPQQQYPQQQQPQYPPQQYQQAPPTPTPPPQQQQPHYQPLPWEPMPSFNTPQQPLQTPPATRTKNRSGRGIGRIVLPMIVALFMLSGVMACTYFTFLIDPIPNSTIVIRWMPAVLGLLFLMNGIGFLGLWGRTGN